MVRRSPQRPALPGLTAKRTWSARSPDGATTVVADEAGGLHVCRPDGVRVVVGHLSDVVTGAVVGRRALRGEVDWLGYLDAGTLLAIRGRDLEVLDAATLATRQTIDLGGEVDAVDLARDGSRLALARGPRVQVFAVER